VRIAALLLGCLALLGAARAEVVDAGAKYPEGPLWHDGRLFVAEMGADAVYVHDKGRKTPYWREDGCGPTSVATYGDGLLVLCHIGAAIVALDARGVEVGRWRSDDDGVRLRDPNDSFADAAGGVYFTDPGVFSLNARPNGAVLYLARDGRLRRVVHDLHYPNGVYVDHAEGALYVDEHMRRRTLRFAITGPGEIGAASVFADINALTQKVGSYREAGPDGLERGPDGDLYVCLYGEGRILRLSPGGTLRASIAVPTPYVTNIAFAPDGSAFVTGSFDNLTPPFPGQVMRLPAATLAGAGPRGQTGNAPR
jgi:gluconolactonase